MNLTSGGPGDDPAVSYIHKEEFREAASCPKHFNVLIEIQLQPNTYFISMNSNVEKFF